jgi:hypothetical protein
MKNILLTIVLVAIAFCFPLQVNAKGKPVSAAQLKDANGETVGRVIGMYHSSRPYVLTDQGYRTNIALPRGWVLDYSSYIYYDLEECEGNAYVSTPRYVGTVFTPDMPVDTAYEEGLIFYIPHDTQSVTVNAKSVLFRDLYTNQQICMDQEETGEGYPVNSNDPTITGIKNTIYPVPMVIE